MTTGLRTPKLAMSNPMSVMLAEMKKPLSAGKQAGNPPKVKIPRSLPPRARARAPKQKLLPSVRGLGGPSI